jgi:hypothetical protein
MQPRFDHRLMCFPVAVYYDFASHVGRLELDEGDCTDMDGAIALFVGIDKRCKRIETYSGRVPDTVYVRSNDRADWQAI